MANDIRRPCGIHEAGVSGSCVTGYGCWEPDPGPLQEQNALLTSEATLAQDSILTLILSLHVAYLSVR